VVLANTLKQGLDQLVAQGKAQQAGTGTQPGTGTNPNPGTGTQPPAVLPGALAQAAAELDTAIAGVRTAQQSGDFVKYGQALAALDAAMTKFQNAQKAAGATPAQTAGPTTGASSAPNPSVPASAGPTPSG